MRVLFLIQGLQHPASRYRVLQFLPGLRRAGIEPHVRVYPKSRAEWEACQQEARTASLLFVQKKRIPGRRLNTVRKLGLPILYDLDDAVMFASSRHLTHRSSTRWRRFRRMTLGCAAVAAGNGYLAELASRFCPRVEVIPTSIPLDRYPLHDHAREDEGLRLGWIGGRKSLVFLRELAPLLERLGRRHPGLRLRIICNEFFELRNVAVEKVPWREEEEAEQVAGVDIGLAPLPDDPWSRGKCATKLLQCMSVGIPCVASAVGAHREVVRAGEGLLAADEAEWEQHLEALLQDSELRARMGQAARRRVQEAYCVAASLPKLIKLIREIAREQ